MMLAKNMSVEDKARNIIDFARSVNENNIDKVVKALLNLIKEQTNENFIEERQGQKITEFRQR
tara:strand:+ start:446 stop:634 length:189 start_codon:yes stop_codon:yes gene_type:complete